MAKTTQKKRHLNSLYNNNDYDHTTNTAALYTCKYIHTFLPNHRYSVADPAKNTEVLLEIYSLLADTVELVVGYLIMAALLVQYY